MATQHAGVKLLEAPFEGFVVDGFNFTKSFPDVRHWLLTHAHSDHTCGLRAGFDSGTIYCSSITKALVCREFSERLGERCVVVDPGDRIFIGERRAHVTAIDAGHCPGAVLFLLEHECGALALHTGDMRASDAVRAAAREAVDDARSRAGRPRQSLGQLYLDTTYANARYDFPAQAEACAGIERIVAREVAREPRTLFLCNAYSVGKENAFDAAIRASGGRGYVPARRAECLRLCGRWDDALHSEDRDGADVAVWVGYECERKNDEGDVHARLAKVLDDSKERYAAVVALRCTGWEYKKSCWGDDGAYEPPVWASDDGRTRTYGVPYSEHSSFPELEAFVAALKPEKLIPTVNAATRKKREDLKGLFVDGVDRSGDRGKIDLYLSAKCGGGPKDPLKAVDVRRQAALLREFAKKKEATAEQADDGDVDAAQLAVLREVVGADAPARYCAKLLADASGDVEQAVAVHFGAHGGAVPASYFAAPCPVDGRGGGGPTEDDDGDLLVGAVFAVRGRDEDFRLFRPSGPRPPKRQRGDKAQQAGGAAEKIRERLRQLGACVVGLHDHGAKKLAPTHVIVPEGAEAGSLVGLDHLVRVRRESWLVKRIRALDAGRVAPPTEADLANAQRRKSDAAAKQVADDVGPRGERRLGANGKAVARPRRRTAETDALVHRALTETMYLVARDDRTRPAPPGACRPPPLVHAFAVMGSTGNVYDVTIEREPSCTCPLALKHKTKVCKHRYFVYYRVLKLPKDDDAVDDEREEGLKVVPHQRYLRRDELKAILLDRAPTDAPLASRAARDAYRRHSGAAAEGSDEAAPSTTAVRRPLDNVCEICFEAFPTGPDALAFADYCKARCGRNFHHDCLKRWFDHKGDTVCPVCSADWALAPAPGDDAPQVEEGFLNLRAHQPGVHAERDASTYATDSAGRRWVDVHGDRAAFKQQQGHDDPPPPPPPPPDSTPPDDDAWF